MTEGVSGSRVKVGAWLVAEDRDRAFDGGSEVGNPLQERTQITVPLLSLDVRLTERLGIQTALSVPDVTRSAVVQRAAGPVNVSETFSGIGDTLVVAWYKLKPTRQWHPVLNFGASLPTGRTETPRFQSELQEGSLVPMSRLQRGSGTLDPVLGATLGKRFRKVTGFGSVAARVPLYDNGDGLRTGASVETNIGAARELWHHRFTGLVRFGWLHRRQDSFRGTPVLVGGGNWLYVTPGVGVLVGKGVNVQAEVKLPVYRAVSNKQLDSRAIFQFGVSRAF